VSLTLLDLVSGASLEVGKAWLARIWQAQGRYDQSLSVTTIKEETKTKRKKNN